MQHPDHTPAAAAQPGTAVAADMPSATPSRATQYLTFTLANELYGIGILSVREILEYREPTVVPMMPAAVRGVMNLRGAVVPVLDPLARFGRASSPVGKRSCIVIVEVEADEQRQAVGLVVDAVSEVLDIGGADIEPPPSFGARIRSDFIAGMGKAHGHFVVLLDTDAMLSIDEIGALSRTHRVH